MQSTIDYEALVRARGTLIFLMGARRPLRYARGLMEAGMAGGTPALLQEGTTAGQRTVLSTLQRLIEDGKEAGIRPPAVCGR